VTYSVTKGDKFCQLVKFVLIQEIGLQCFYLSISTELVAITCLLVPIVHRSSLLFFFAAFGMPSKGSSREFQGIEVANLFLLSQCQFFEISV